ncbi:telomere recombination-domain-containing protein [Aspergillus cavernicola]|uniref:Threonylcarbamoyl-AMP synthase n=1 Tax=Aspergillus cavernicola TaxID=176166 RepID=A0ABR4J3S2_9EURO
MKQRFSSLDVQVISQELASELVGLRVSNIYDLSTRIFLFKLAKPDHRKQLIVDSGFRCHVTQYSRATASAPSPFVSRLRKCLKSRRITSVTQIGTDRIIDFSFSDGMYHMLLEFFASGNVIITDRDYNIIALLRQVPGGEGLEEAKIGLKYTVTNKQNYNGVPDITTDRIRETLEKAKALFAEEPGAPKKSKKKKNTDVLRKALSQGFPEYPPLLLDHAFATRGADPATPLDQVLGDEGLMDMVREVLEEARGVTADLSMDKSHPGFIVAKEDTRPTAPDPNAEKEASPAKPGLLYEDFHPFKPRQFEGREGFTILEYPSMNATIDEYFSSIESQKLESRLTEREEVAKKKLNSLRQEHEKRIGALEQAQDLHIRKANAIQDNVYRVQEATDAVNGLIAQGMDWVEIARLIEMEQSRGNPVASVIKLPLKLYENTITLLLREAGAEEEEEDELFSSDESENSDDEDHDEPTTSKRHSESFTIDIDLGLSPWANATQYYDQKRVAAVKAERTTQSSSKALKSHEKKVKDDLKRNLKQEKQVLRPSRNPFWFEKFLFFISSEGYLILGGRDSMQSELLYRRHLRKGDIFVHADLDGATPMIVKNKAGAPSSSISPSTLSQAGNLCVATSTAWDSKAIMSAWWVEASQVKKTAQGGDLLPVGDFLVKGEKNFLAPSQLVLGFAVMWQVSKDNLSNHKTYISEEAPAVEQSKKEQIVTEDANETETNRQEDEDDSESVGDPHETEEQTEAQDEVEEEDLPGDNQSTLDDVASVTSQAHGKRHLSGRDKRLLRKGKPLDTPTQKSEQASGRSTPMTNGTSTKDTKPTPAPVRGRKGKNKKAASKYADQDEDERELALRLLGASGAKAQKAAADAEVKAKREQEAEEQKKRRKAQHERAAQAERKRQALFEEGGGDDYDEETAAAEAADLEWLPALVGTPNPEDEILAAIPVCAPWASLGRYKYRVKLQPGAVKKGKAVKEILGRWVAETTTGKVKKEHAEDAGISRTVAEKLRGREGELLKGWKDTEIINTIPVGKVRIMIGPGGGGGGDKAKGKGGGGNKGGKVNLLPFLRRLVARGSPRSFTRPATTTTAATMTPKETTQIASVIRLNKEGPGNRSLAEWWANEQSRNTPEAVSIAEAARLLQTSDIPVAFPTETVYGLGADATRSDAVQGIYRAKQRPSDNPLIVHVDSLEMLDRLLNPSRNTSPGGTKTARNSIPPIYVPLIERFWPGPLTILLPNPSGSCLAPQVTSNLTTFGVRMPSSPLARLLIHVADRPLAAPSANASTKPSPTAAEHVHHDLQGRIELILDGGLCGVGVESTVVDGLSSPPSILRPGGVAIEELRSCPGWEDVQLGYHDGTFDVKEVPRAPGMKYRHYSPKARVVLFEAGSGEQAVLKHVRRDLEDTAVGAHSIGIVRTRSWKRGLQLLPEDEVEKTLKTVPSLVDDFAEFAVPVGNKTKQVFDCHLGSDTKDIARGLFAVLRAMDEKEVDVIYVEGVSDSEYLAAAVMNRLRKAAGSTFKV